MNLTDLLVPTYRNMLQTLQGLLDKAEAQLGPEKAEALLSARLAPECFRSPPRSASPSCRHTTGLGACAARSILGG